MENWKKNKAIPILKEIGIKKGQDILDFGCGEGVYTILISKIIGPESRIYALDYDEDSLEELSDKLSSKHIKNVEIIKTDQKIQVPLPNNSIDIVILYDVYHLLNSNERDKLLQESFRVLRRNGFISYHATHIGSYDINLERVGARMNKFGFRLGEKYQKPMFHWAWIEENQVLNYYKKEKS
ncbi:MAG: methyltransferase domain-containing protein [Candidatus Lokiarchaeota archaeon]|nr:methyltransferase domain-containing protein [Candidatus Lokiarchaeota archaeon]